MNRNTAPAISHLRRPEQTKSSLTQSQIHFRAARYNMRLRTEALKKQAVELTGGTGSARCTTRWPVPRRGQPGRGAAARRIGQEEDDSSVRRAAGLAAGKGKRVGEAVWLTHGIQDISVMCH